MSNTFFDIIIIGYGPTGATLANLLGQYGHKVAVIEKEPAIYPFPRAVHLDDETLRIFQSLSIIPQLQDSIAFFDEMQLSAKIGKPLVKLKTGEKSGKYGYGSDYWFDQPSLERVLRAKTETLPNVEVFLGWKVTKISQTAHATLVRITKDTKQQHLSGSYLIGCDGANSFVRQQSGIELDDLNFQQNWLVVDTFWQDHPPKLWSVHQQICDPQQPISFIPGVGKHYRWEFMLDDMTSHQSSKILASQFLRKIQVLDQVNIVRSAIYTFQAKLAKNWQQDRVLLAGDAAHQMPPFLGQGMCSGIRDAVNLAWKLHLVLNTLAPSNLLQHYQEERALHVKTLIKGAITLGKLIQTRQPLAATIRNSILKLLHFSPPLLHLIKNQIVKKEKIKHGFLGNHSKLAGQLFIQPIVQAHSSEKAGLLDNYLGNGFALIFNSSIPKGIHSDLMKRLPICIFTIAQNEDSVQSLTDVDLTLTKWFHHHQVAFVLLRPDRHIYDAGKLASFPTIFQLFCDQFKL